MKSLGFVIVLRDAPSLSIIALLATPRSDHATVAPFHESVEAYSYKLLGVAIQAVKSRKALLHSYSVFSEADYIFFKY